MNGTDERDLPTPFYTGTSYLGKPVSIGLQGETPTASPSAGASAIPSGAVGAQAPSGARDAATGISGVSSSTLLQALQALGLARGTASLAGKIGGDGGVSAGAGLGTEVPPPANFPSGTELPGGQVEIGHQIIPGAEPVPGGAPAGEAIESTGAAPAPTAGGEAGSEGTQAATAGSSAADIATGVAGLLEIALPELFGRGGQQASSVIGLGGLAAAPFFPPAALLAIPDLISLFSGHGLPGFGPPPAMGFPKQNLIPLEKTVKEKMPAALEAPAGVSPEVKSWIDAANKEREDILGTYQAEKLGAGRYPFGEQQSAETWRNVWDAFTGGLKDRFGYLQGLYETSLQGLSGLPVPGNIPAFPGRGDRPPIGAEGIRELFPQLAHPLEKLPEKATIPPPAFFRGERKLPDEEQAA